MTSLQKLRFTLVGFIIMTYFVIFLNSYHLFEANTYQFQIKNDKTESLRKLAKVMVKFHKALRYFEANSKYVNLDGLFGLRISQGYLLLAKYTFRFYPNLILNFLRNFS